MGLILDIVDKVVPRVQGRLSRGEELKIALMDELQKEVAQSLATKQGKEHIKESKDIIPPGTDLDNGEAYNIETGITIKELY